MEQVVCPPALKQVYSQYQQWIILITIPVLPLLLIHGTSLIQYPSNTSDKEEHNPPAIVTGGNSGCKTVGHLPHSIMMSSPLHPVLNRQLFLLVVLLHSKEMSINCMLRSSTNGWKMVENRELENVSLAAYHAENQEARDITVTPTVLIPLFQESAHTVVMIRHSIDIVRNAVEHLNLGQTPVLTLDQSLLL